MSCVAWHIPPRLPSPVPPPPPDRIRLSRSSKYASGVALFKYEMHDEARRDDEDDEDDDDDACVDRTIPMRFPHRSTRGFPCHSLAREV